MDREDNSKRIELKVLGLSVGQIRQGAYALILAEVNGPIRIPVVIGATEANAISARMERIITRRPLVHDLFASMAHAFSLELVEVFIHKFEDGVYYSELTFTNGERTVTIDSRTSDAIAIAMRTGSPIYTTPEILHECGFVIENEPFEAEQPSGSEAKPTDDELTPEQIDKLLAEAIEAENYEEAARLSALKAKKNEQ